MLLVANAGGTPATPNIAADTATAPATFLMSTLNRPFEFAEVLDATVTRGEGGRNSVGAYCSGVQVDAMTVPQPLGKIGDLARRVARAGFSGLLFTETGRTAYLNAAVASQAAPGLELSTGVAVAFPRSPFVTAASAWELQEATGGKFRLGLGTQVRTHVVRRYGMEFERPGPRLRDYVRAVKACFHAFRTGRLDHHGD